MAILWISVLLFTIMAPHSDRLNHPMLGIELRTIKGVEIKNYISIC